MAGKMTVNWAAFLDSDLNQLIWNFMEIGIFFILLVFGILFLWLYLKKRKETPVMANFNLGYGFFFLVQCVNQLFYMFLVISNGSLLFTPEMHDYLVQSALIFIVGMSKPLIKLAFQIFYMFIFFQISFLFVLFPTEKYLRNSKKYPVSILLGLSIVFGTFLLVVAHFVPSDYTLIPGSLMILLGILDPVMVAEILLAFLLGMIMAVIYYIIIGAKTTGELRRKSFLTAFGFIIWFLSVVIGNLLKPSMHGISILIGPVMFYAGTIILMYSFLRKE